MLKRIALITALLVFLSYNTVVFASEEATTSTEVATVRDDSENEEHSKVSWKTVVMLIIVGCGAVEVYTDSHKDRGEQSE